jgi:hypothetical protein
MLNIEYMDVVDALAEANKWLNLSL